MTEKSPKQSLARTFVGVVLLTAMFVIDVILTPMALAAPALAVLVYGPGLWKFVSIPLALPVFIYLVAYFAIRDTDPAWPVAPAERFVFNRMEDEHADP